MEQRRHVLNRKQAARVGTNDLSQIGLGPCRWSSFSCGPVRGMAEWQLECFVHSSCVSRRCFISILKFFLLCL